MESILSLWEWEEALMSFSGHIKRAPMWMQKANLEWLFRVANEPKRLFKRYFVGNATFIKRVIHEKRKAKKIVFFTFRGPWISVGQNALSISWRQTSG